MTPAQDPKQGNRAAPSWGALFIGANNFPNFPIFRIFVIFAIFGSNMGFLGVGRCLKSFLEVLRFVVTEYRAVRSHGDLIRVENYVFF